MVDRVYNVNIDLIKCLLSHFDKTGAETISLDKNIIS